MSLEYKTPSSSEKNGFDESTKILRTLYVPSKDCEDDKYRTFFGKKSSVTFVPERMLFPIVVSDSGSETVSKLAKFEKQLFEREVNPIIDK